MNKFIINPCKKGKIIFVLVNSKSNYNFLAKFLIMNNIIKKRGIFVNNGIVILATYFFETFIKYVDLFIKIIDGKNGRKN